MSDNNQKKDLLEILKARLGQAEANLTVAEQKAQFLVGTTSILLAIAGVLQLPGTSENVTARIFLGGAAFLYGLLLAICIKVLYPINYDYPVALEWDELRAGSAMETDQYLDTLISEYAGCADTVMKASVAKAKLVSAGFWLLGFIALFMVASAGFSAWS